jgi:hypothetical protein
MSLVPKSVNLRALQIGIETSGGGSGFISDDGATPMTADWNIGGHKITSLLDPVNPFDAATKNYVDLVAQGLTAKPAATVTSQTNIVLSGTQMIDGVNTVDGNIVLLRGQTDPIENGMWVVHAGAWARHADMPAGSHAGGSFVFVEQGGLYADTGWVCSSDSPNDIVGTNNLNWVQFSGAGAYSAGTGLDLTGTQFSVLYGTTAGTALEGSQDANYVHLTGTEFVGGAKTFTSGLTVQGTDFVAQTNAYVASLTAYTLSNDFTVRFPAAFNLKFQTWNGTTATNVARLTSTFGLQIGDTTTWSYPGVLIANQNVRAGSAIYSIDLFGFPAIMLGANGNDVSLSSFSSTGVLYLNNAVAANTVINSGNNTFHDILTLTSPTIFVTPAAGYGSALAFKPANAAGTGVVSGRITSVWSNAGAGTEVGAMTFQTLTGGSLTERMRIAGSGGVTIGTSGTDPGTGVLRVEGNEILTTTTAATGGAQLVSSPTFTMRGAAWNGSSSANQDAAWGYTPQGTQDGTLGLSIGGSTIFRFQRSAQSFPATQAAIVVGVGTLNAVALGSSEGFGNVFEYYDTFTMGKSDTAGHVGYLGFTPDSFTTHLKIWSTGNIRIGSTNTDPTYKLQVDGTTNTTSYAVVSRLMVADGVFTASSADPGAGNILLGNAKTFYGRNAANNANLSLLTLDSSNNVVLGNNVTSQYAVARAVNGGAFIVQNGVDNFHRMLSDGGTYVIGPAVLDTGTTTPAASTIRTPNIASASNIAPGALNLATGSGRGSGATAFIALQTNVPTSPGTGAQSVVSRMTVGAGVMVNDGVFTTASDPGYGNVLLGNTKTLYGRNAANGGNIGLIGLDSSDRVVMGNATAGAMTLRFQQQDGLTFQTWNYNSGAYESIFNWGGTELTIGGGSQIDAIYVDAGAAGSLVLSANGPTQVSFGSGSMNFQSCGFWFGGLGIYTANHTIAYTENVALGDATGGAFNFQLPNPNRAGFGLWVKNIGTANNVTLVRNAAEKINGTAANFAVTPGVGGFLVSDGTDWHFVR